MCIILARLPTILREGEGGKMYYFLQFGLKLRVVALYAPQIAFASFLS